MRELLDTLKHEHAESFASIDRTLAALIRDGHPITVQLEESGLIGPEARVVPSKIDVME